MVKQSAVQDPAANGEEGLANVANGTGWLSEDFELPTWSRTLAGWRERFHLPFSLPLLPGGHKQLSIGQRPVASSSHKQEAAASADGLATGSTVWDAGIVLAAHVFARHANAGSGQLRCLDLGAGTGLVGLAAAASGAFSCVLLTDLPSVLPLTRSNAEANAAVCGSASVRVMPLRWDSKADVQTASAHGPFDLIMGGDLLYRPQVVQPLMHVLCGLAIRQGGCVLLAASIQHSPETLRLFAAAAVASFDVQLLPLGAQASSFTSEEVRLLRLTPR